MPSFLSEKFQLLLGETKLEHERSCKEAVNMREEFDHPKYIYHIILGEIILWDEDLERGLLQLRGSCWGRIWFYHQIRRPLLKHCLWARPARITRPSISLSVHSWLVVSNWDSWFFFKPFARGKIDIILETYHRDGLAVSSSPTCEDCLVMPRLQVQFTTMVCSIV